MATIAFFMHASSSSYNRKIEQASLSTSRWQRTSRKLRYSCENKKQLYRHKVEHCARPVVIRAPYDKHYNMYQSNGGHPNFYAVEHVFLK